MQEDLDIIFSYHTRQQVQVRDIWLGVLERALQACVLLYILVGVFFYGESHYETDHNPGLISMSVSGSAVGVSQEGSQSRFFGAYDLMGPGLENGNVFLTTKVDVQQQVRGICEDFDLPCLSAADCPQGVGATCSKEGFCHEPSWCPVSSGGAPAESYKVPLDNIRIWVKSAVTFFGEPQLYHSRFDAPIPFPRPGYNTFSVKDFLLSCNPPVRLEEIAELGAAIEVQFVWRCTVGNFYGCHVNELMARRIDKDFDTNGEIGFNYKVAVSTGQDRREVQQRKGIRFYFRTAGFGSKLSLSEIIVKFSMGLSLINLVPMITDWVMLYVSKLRIKYRARKFIYSEDFSDYFDVIDIDINRTDPLEEFLAKSADLIHQFEMDDEHWKYTVDEYDA